MTWVCIKNYAFKAFVSSCSTFNNFSKTELNVLTPHIFLYCEYGFRDKIDNPPK